MLTEVQRGSVSGWKNVDRVRNRKIKKIKLSSKRFVCILKTTFNYPQQIHLLMNIAASQRWQNISVSFFFLLKRRKKKVFNISPTIMAISFRMWTTEDDFGSTNRKIFEPKVSQKFPTEISEWKMCLPLAILRCHLGTIYWWSGRASWSLSVS